MKESIRFENEIGTTYDITIVPVVGGWTVVTRIKNGDYSVVYPCEHYNGESMIFASIETATEAMKRDFRLDTMKQLI
jgi:hypothetical protein